MKTRNRPDDGCGVLDNKMETVRFPACGDLLSGGAGEALVDGSQKQSIGALCDFV